MKKKSIWVLVFISLFSLSVLAEDVPQNQLTIKLLFPKKSTSLMTAPRPELKPQEVCGLVVIDITPVPSKIEEDRYLVEYFLDEQLIYQTTGFNEENPTQVSFSYTLDTTKYENGLHKLIVNFWDKSGPSAIGIREVIIDNSGETNE